MASQLRKGLDDLERFSTLASGLFEAQVRLRDTLDDERDIAVVRHEDAMDWNGPERQLAELSERVGRSAEVSSLGVLAGILRSLNQADQERWKALHLPGTTPRHDSPPSAHTSTEAVLCAFLRTS